MDYELLLYDRIEVIKTIIEKHGEENFYLSFSGGKDSTVLSHLLDMALPGNKIPRVFIDTGIEYLAIRSFVSELVNQDKRFLMIKPTRSIKAVLEKEGYPFKSKEHSHKVGLYQNGSRCASVLNYKEGKSMISCPKALQCQYEEGYGLHLSDSCCKRLKKEPAHKYERESGRTIAITAMRREEKGQRAHIGCVLTDSKGKLRKFHPLAVVDDSFEEWLITREGIKLCKLYYPPYNFKRTGCKGCPFSLDLQDQLTTMATYLPAEREQCEMIWKPVYDEYRRLGYRLSEVEQLKLF